VEQRGRLVNMITTFVRLIACRSRCMADTKQLLCQRQKIYGTIGRPEIRPGLAPRFYFTSWRDEI